MKEVGARFGNGRSLVGVLTHPPEPRDDDVPGVLILNAGLVHHVGPNRLHVKLARDFARRGHPVLRFDFTGIGDSPPARDAVPPSERWVTETREAMDFLADNTGATRFIAIGSCSGAVLSYRTAVADDRVVGVGLINPAGPTLFRHYLRTARRHLSTWRRLLRGRARLRAQYVAFVRRAQQAGTRKARRYDLLSELRRLAERRLDILLVLSEWDPSYDYYRHVLRKQLAAAGLTDSIRCRIIPGADHQLSVVASQNRLADILHEWIADDGT
jgi:pimeloyl-ACP methyl ester carboxylesterase